MSSRFSLSAILPVRLGAGVLVATLSLLGSGQILAASQQIAINMSFRAWWAENGKANYGSNAYAPNDQPQVWKAGASFAAGANPWNQTFLNELAPFSVIRTMEWGPTNNSAEQYWWQRRSKTDTTQVGDPMTKDDYNAEVGGTRVKSKGVAWEWRIDLSNRTSKHMWVNVPQLADDDYVNNLATLIKNNLNSNLNVYLEYGNEFWYSANALYDYCWNQAQSVKPPNQSQTISQLINGNSAVSSQGSPSDRNGRAAFYLYRSAQIVKKFNDVFGSSSGRIKWVPCGLLGDGWERTIWNAALRDTRINYHNLWPAYAGRSFYFGTGDGSNLQSDFNSWKANLEESKTQVKSLMGLDLVLYEFGTDFSSGNMSAQSSQYAFWKDQICPAVAANTVFGCAYSYCTGYQSSGNNMGLKAYIGQPNSEAHRYRGVIDYIGASSGGGGGTATDDISSISVPTSVASGSGTATVTVNFTTAGSGRKIYAGIHDNSSTWVNKGGASVDASGTSATITISYSGLTSSVANYWVGLFSSDWATTYDSATAQSTVGTSSSSSVSVVNPGFESNGSSYSGTVTGWSEWDNITGDAIYSSGDHERSGSSSLNLYGGSAFQAYPHQKFTALASGTYTFKAWIKGGGTFNSLGLSAKTANGGTSYYAALTPTGTYTEYTLNNIAVTSDGTLEIGFWADGVDANSWVSVDDVTVTKN